MSQAICNLIGPQAVLHELILTLSPDSFPVGRSLATRDYVYYCSVVISIQIWSKYMFVGNYGYATTTTVQSTRHIYVEQVCVFLFFFLLLYSRYSPIYHDSFYSRPHPSSCQSVTLLMLQLQASYNTTYKTYLCRTSLFFFFSSFSYCTLDIHLSIMTVSIRGHTHPHVNLLMLQLQASYNTTYKTYLCRTSELFCVTLLFKFSSFCRFLSYNTYFYSRSKCSFY